MISIGWYPSKEIVDIALKTENDIHFQTNYFC